MPPVLRLSAAVLAAVVLSILSPIVFAANDSIYLPLDETGVYSANDYSFEVTDCDRLAGHPSDPNAITDGVSRAGMDKPAVIEACRKAMAADPANLRLTMSWSAPTATPAYTKKPNRTARPRRAPAIPSRCS